jgi:hypothetical protein
VSAPRQIDWCWSCGWGNCHRPLLHRLLGWRARPWAKQKRCRHDAVTYHGHPDAPRGMCLRCGRVERLP